MAWVTDQPKPEDHPVAAVWAGQRRQPGDPQALVLGRVSIE